MTSSDSKEDIKISSVTLPKDFVFEKPLAETITSLTFDDYFDQRIPDGWLPSKLVHINFGHYFTKTITSQNIPATVETMVCGYWFESSLCNLSRRNLKSITVCDNYRQLVPDELLPVMSQNYQTRYSSFKKLTPKYEISKIDDKLLPIVENQDLNKEIEQIRSLICPKRGNHRSESFDGKINDQNQIELKFVSCFWYYLESTYIGRNNVFYRVFRRETYVPKNRTSDIYDEKLGPFTHEEVMDDSCTSMND